MNRRLFVRQASLGVGAALLAPLALAQTASDRPLQLDPDKVLEFVKAGHNDLANVRTMLAEQPDLIYAAWDWGGGDFETALEGAGHTGESEIAEYLIEQGARPNLFVLAMLGKTPLVTAVLDEFPNLLRARGPHGFTLLHHARKGGEPAAELAVWLEKQGLTETKLPLT